MGYWFEYYAFMKNNRMLHEFFQPLDVDPEEDSFMEIVVFDWSPIVFYELPLLIVYLLYLYFRGCLNMPSNETAFYKSGKIERAIQKK
ncbi:MAG: hypothetical protein Q6368_000775 [Candidatus Baldrarchaeota archaeon]